MTGSEPAIEWKQKAGEAAVESVASGMVVGLGTGSTAIWAVRGLADRIQQRALTDIMAVPTSLETEREARRLDIPLTTLESSFQMDVVIDGADEVDPDFNLIKGGGGALLKEKIVAQAGRRVIIVVEETKLSSHVGKRCPLPVEVIPFGWKTQQFFLENLGATVSLRLDKRHNVYITEQGNYILNCRFGPIHEPGGLAQRLKDRAGIVEHGLFLQMATDLIIAGPRGLRHHTASGPAVKSRFRFEQKGNPAAPELQNTKKKDP